MAQSALRRYRSSLIPRALSVAAWIAEHIPLPIGQKLGKAVGTLAWWVVPHERERALSNIALAFPDWDVSRRRKVIRSMFQHLGMALFEIGWLPNLTPKTLPATTVVEGIEHLEGAVKRGQGVIAFGSHCGNWEWLAATFGILGYDLHVMAREVYDSRMNDFIVDARLKSKVKTIGRGSSLAAKEMLLTLRRGGVLAFLIDQNIQAESALINFFGHPALTPVGPAKLAIRTGAASVVAFVERRGGKHYVLVEPLDNPGNSDDPVRLTELVTRRIEDQIRKAPEQWVWMHQRWKQRTKVKIVE